MRRVPTTDLQIRGVPVALRERLRRRASRKGVSMSQYVTDLLDEDLAKPTIKEWLDEVAALPKIALPKDYDTAELMREEEEEREEELHRRTSSSTRR
ncbi:MAG TPA: hypothetical protein VEU77_02805 [Candidatus Acidoferrales bacterium]|nr:hypothetical protein [Candidatus Acidoferrales bacterium]